MGECKTCGKTEVEVEFYDSIKTYCKEHWKQRVRENRRKNIDHYRSFDRRRANLPHRVEARQKYSRTEAWRRSHNTACKKYEENHPDKRRAHVITGNAISSGSLKKEPCEVCRSLIVQAHHDDYTKPLEVRWLCAEHHAEHHVKLREQSRTTEQAKQ